jgi:hypothetical protein
MRIRIGQTKKSQKVKFLPEKCIKIGDLGQKLTLEGTEAVLKGRNQVNFGQFPCSWIRIRIRIPNTDLDSGSRKSKSIRIQTGTRIHNTARQT